MSNALTAFLLVVGGVIFGAALGLLLRSIDSSILDSDWLFWGLVAAMPLVWLIAFATRRKRAHGRISLDKSP